MGRPNGVVVLHLDNVPVFGSIVDIIVLQEDEFHLVCEVLHTECFNSHFHAYEICNNEEPEFNVCMIHELVDHCCLSKNQLQSYPHSWFVPLKYYIADQ